MANFPDLLTTRIPPHSLEAERAVLGTILLEPQGLPRIVELLHPESFYREGHRKIFEAMIGLFDRNEPVDALTVTDELRRRGMLDEVGGAGTLAALVEESATAAHMMAYANIVREKAILREMIEISKTIIEQSYEGAEEVDVLLDRAEQLIFQIAEARMRHYAIPVRAILKDTFEYIEQLYHRKEHVTGLPTGFKRLDLLTSGLQPSEFIIVAGRPSMGKTAFCLNVAQHVAIRAEPKRNVLILSLEMSKEQIVQRLLCSEARVDAHRLRTGTLDDRDWPRLTAAAGRMAEAQIWIDDTPGLGVLEARAKARRMKAEHGLDLVIIDYLQLMRGRGQAENRQQEISEISRSLKALAKEMRVPVMALSQLSRAVEARAQRDYRPQLSDLRESGALEQDADLIIFLYRPERYGIQTENEGMAEAIIGKQRNGPVDTVPLVFISAFTRFEEPETRRTPF